MKLLNKIILITIILSSPLTAVAGGWAYSKNIQHLYAGEAGNRYAIKLTGTQPNPDACASTTDLIIDSNNTKLKEMWAMLLSAYMANKTVSVHLSGCSTGNNRPIVTDIILGTL